MTKPTKHSEIMETLELLARGIAETQTMLREVATEVGMLHGRVHSIVDARFFRHYETPPQATTDLNQPPNT